MFIHTSVLTFLDPTNVTIVPEMIIAPKSFMKERFTCKGFGIPLPELVWYKDDEYGELNEENYTIYQRIEISPLGYQISISELIFESFDKFTEGNYICQGYNNVTNIIGATDEAISVFYLEGKNCINIFSQNLGIMFKLRVSKCLCKYTFGH